MLRRVDEATLTPRLHLITAVGFAIIALSAGLALWGGAIFVSQAIHWAAAGEWVAVPGWALIWREAALPGAIDWALPAGLSTLEAQALWLFEPQHPGDLHRLVWLVVDCSAAALLVAAGFVVFSVYSFVLGDFDLLE
jgi:hypothetical protein